MGCILLLIALAIPRVILLLAFLFTDGYARAFETHAWPLLGFFFMPYGTLAYGAAMLNNNHALTGGWLIVFIAAIVLDVAHWGGGNTYRKKSKGS